MIDMPTLAFAMCGSFCTFEKALAQLALLRKDWDMLPVMSETAYTTDTRFGTAESFHERIENDALGASCKNIGLLMNTKNIYFVPLGQDDPIKKPNSLVAHFDLIPETLASAVRGEQLQPVLR